MTASPATPRPTVILATLVAIAIALAVLATAATVIVASDVTRERERLQEAGIVTAMDVAEARGQLAGQVGLRALVDTLVAELAPFESADQATIERMTVLWGGAVPEHAAYAAASDSIPAPATDAATLAGLLQLLTGEPVDSAAQPAPDALPRALADTASPWLATWRRFARSSPLPAFWGYRKGLPGVTSVFDLPTRNVSGARYLLRLNELAGRVALRDGDIESARSRGLENLAASRHYLDSPVLLDFVMGRSFALSGARLVEAAARARGDTITVRQVDALTSAAGSALAFTALRRAAELDAASPDGTLAYELFEDEKLPYAVRVEILYAAIAGACNHTREVLFGFDPDREARLSAVAVAHRDHPVMGPVLGLVPAAARRVREAPTSLLSDDVWPTAGLLDGLLPEGVAARAVLCQQGI